MLRGREVEGVLRRTVVFGGSAEVGRRRLECQQGERSADWTDAAATLPGPTDDRPNPWAGPTSRRPFGLWQYLSAGIVRWLTVDG
jgi:hypothetical protein